MPISSVTAPSTAPARAPGSDGPNLAPLVALNSNLPADMSRFPGLRTFLTQNAGAIAGGSPPPKSVSTNFDVQYWAWEGDDEKKLRNEFVVVLAEGSAYGGRGGSKVTFRTHDDSGNDAGTKVIPGKIVDVFNFQDLPPQVSSDGAGAEGYRSLKLSGRQGEKVKFRFVKVAFDSAGRADEYKSGWTDATGGAYSGREQTFKILANQTVRKPAPD
jgi:hypothetical protein